eukprot:TRINITY_DN30409_c0_g1_i1.p1 TRINITY_DN30409_c0_g1~~TRINITY_DN30409_c0_g1_i1.p1  ORF type:complete len:286 (-),score=22.30 TRINITY_DN30409_c0_g1_i1:483-1319(-)
MDSRDHYSGASSDPSRIAPLPSLEHSPLTMERSQKDWFRLLHKLTQDTLTPRDVVKSSEAQLGILLPLLMQLPHLSDALMQRLSLCPALETQAFWWARSHMTAVDGTHLALALRIEPAFRTAIAFLESLVVTIPKEGQVFEGIDLLDPFAEANITASPPCRFSSAIVLKLFASGHSPILLKLCTTVGIPRLLLLKPDDVRRDANVSVIFEIFNYLWRHSWINADKKPCAVSFRILPCGPNFGLLGYVVDAIPLREFDFNRILTYDREQLEVKGRHRYS